PTTNTTAATRDVLTRATSPLDSSTDRVTGPSRTTQRVSITDATARSEEADGNFASTTATTQDGVAKQEVDVSGNGSKATTVPSARTRDNVVITTTPSSVMSTGLKPEVMSAGMVLTRKVLATQVLARKVLVRMVLVRKVLARKVYFNEDYICLSLQMTYARREREGKRRPGTTALKQRWQKSYEKETRPGNTDLLS
ncbi:hypothetical protein LSAT2_021912, partial [Lamellibrachia satsuma]